jgi:hypothetical protein
MFLIYIYIMKIRILRINPSKAELVPAMDPSKKNFLMPIQIDFCIQKKEECHEICVDVGIYTVAPGQKIGVFSSVKTLFQIESIDRAFLSSPTYPLTISLSCELASTAIGHARMHHLRFGEEKKLGDLLLPHYNVFKLEELVKASLLSCLN